MTPRIKKLVLAALIFLAAFVVRYYNWQLEGINPDEPAWQTRIENFTSAISRGEWQYTQQSLHHGVTLNWIASFGRALSGYNSPGRLVYPFVDPLIFWSVHFSELFMIILVVASGCGLIFWLLTRLLDTPTAFVGALLLSLDPFYIASSRVLQMDALLASFMVVSFLAALVYAKTSKRRYLVLSGLFAGLSLLTKINGAVILPVVGLVLVSQYINSPVARSQWRLLFRDSFLFGLVVSACFFVLYPAMWVQPVLTIKNLIYGITSRGLTEGGESMGDVFFCGRVLYNPGPWFYPAVVLFRATPLVMVGVFSSLPILLRKTETKKAVAWCLLFKFLVVLEMTLVAKKSERYILPIFLVLDILGAVGIVGLFRIIFRKVTFPLRATNSRNVVTNLPVLAVSAIIVVIQFTWLVHSLSWHYGAYYNPLVGGAPAALQKVTVGFGEGLSEVADFINTIQKTSPLPISVSAFYGDSIRPAVKVGDIWYPDHWNRGDRGADLVVFYINQLQRGRNGSLWQEYKDKAPLKTVRINGIDYAYIYKGPRVY